MTRARTLILFLTTLAPLVLARSASAQDDAWPPTRRYHAPPEWAIPLMRNQHEYDLISPLVRDDGSRVESADEWPARRGELLRHWQAILGKLEPTTEERQQWIGDITQVVVHEDRLEEGYRRIRLDLPLERDFPQQHLLLIPTGQGAGPFPAVIAWTATTPDYQEPEQWWGAWLARHGFVVLTGWSFIRHYRDDSNFNTGAPEKVYERYGHWLAMAKMTYDVRREVEYLRARPEVDASRVGFIGFSLSAKTALYVAAFAPEVAATVSIDPHVSLHGATNYEAPWYLDWRRRFPGIHTEAYPVPELRGTVWSLLDADPQRPGFERNHHELIALAAPRPLMVIGCSMDQPTAVHSDDAQSWGYFQAGRDVYRLLGVADRFDVVPLNVGHRATSPEIDAAWQRFFTRWLRPPR